MPSTVVLRMEYQPLEAILRIVFVSGMIYDYLNVPLEVYNEMKQSRSKGGYLNKNIKGNYEFRKVKEGKQE